MLDLLLGEIGGRVVGPGRAELAAAMGSPSVVVALVLGRDQLQMPLAAGYTAAVCSAASVQSVFAPGVPGQRGRAVRVLPRSGYLTEGGTAGLTPPLPEGDAAPGGVKDARDR